MSGPGIVFVNRSYWPEETATAQLLTDLAEALVARGRRVTVVARDTGTLAPTEERRGVQISRVPGSRWDGPGLAPKAAQFLAFWRGARRAVASALKPGDAVVTLTDPPLFGAAATAIARRRGASSWHWIQDIYPEVAQAVTGGRGWNVFRPLRDRAWRRADGCVTLGTDMGSLVAERGVRSNRLHLLSNWAPAGLTPPADDQIAAQRENWGAGREFVIGYSGNLGRVHDLDAILALAEALRTEPDIRFQFTGSGPQRARIEATAARRGLTRVKFAPPAPRERLAAALAAADLHLVTLRAGCERCVYPSKLYGIAAVGRPVLFLGPPGSEIARQIVSAGMGIAAAATDPAGAAGAVRAWRDRPELLRAAASASLQFGRGHSGPAAAADLWDRLTRSG